MVNEALDKLFKPYKVYFLYKESDNLELLFRGLWRWKINYTKTWVFGIQ